MVKHGFTLLWIAGIAIVLQTLFNTELMRYTIATGEPVLTGFMRTKPRSSFWAWFYVILGFLQLGWPAWAGTAAGAIFFPLRQAAAGSGGRQHGLHLRGRDLPGLLLDPAGRGNGSSAPSRCSTGS
jgi:hypothetical protein